MKKASEEIARHFLPSAANDIGVVSCTTGPFLGEVKGILF